MMLMDKLDAAAAANGASVDIYWFHDVRGQHACKSLGRSWRGLERSAKFHLEKMKADVGDNLFAAEEDVVTLGKSLIANGSFDSAEDVQRYRQLLKSYRKLFRTTRRLMRLSDHNEQRFETAAEELSHSVSGLRALGEVSQAVNSTLDLETVLYDHRR